MSAKSDSHLSGQPRWWAIGLCALVASAALVIAVLALRQSTASRQSLRLVDSAGNERVRMVATGDGGYLELLGSDGKPRISIREAGTEIGIELLAADKDGRSLKLLVSEKSQTLIVMRGEGANGQSIMKLGADDHGGLSLTSSSGGGFSLSNASTGTGLMLSYQDKVALVSLDANKADLLLNAGKVSSRLSSSAIHSELELLVSPGHARLHASADELGSRVVVDERKPQ
jgi:hypothetical protein